ncbi:MAG: YkgJ family cysteine cluster protein [Gammaproteobacteria bacterium]|nr:YkgJ family cysteine cluster protein [Gammaproteobacteria bacterium]
MKECNSCGKCCTKYGAQDLSVTEQELELWELFNPEIFQYSKNGKVWFDPQTGKPLKTCPWLVQLDKKTICSIYQSRPQDCKSYPSLVTEVISDGCEMLEESDIGNIKKAQQQLDVIMLDSRN